MVKIRRKASTGSAADRSSYEYDDYTVSFGGSKPGNEGSVTSQYYGAQHLYDSDPELSFCSEPLTNETVELNNKPLGRNPYLNMKRTSSLSSNRPRKGDLSFLQSNYFWRAFAFVQYCAFIATLYFGFSTHRTMSSQLGLLDEVTDMYESVNRRIIETERELYETHQDFTHLNMKLNVFSPLIEYTPVNNAETRNRVSNTFINRSDAQVERILRLKGAIQKYDLMKLERRYGSAPYYIEFTVQIEGQRKFFTIQTAPTEFAPHAIKTFLDMVEHKVWDGTVFYHQVNHVTVASPIDLSGKRKDPEVAKKTLFTEHNSEYPHKKFTVGFQGHPGGPEFYINMENNEKIHGPGGQSYHDVTDDGDTCFAEVIHGEDVVEQFAMLNKKVEMTKAGMLFSLIEKVTILRIDDGSRKRRHEKS